MTQSKSKDNFGSNGKDSCLLDTNIVLGISQATATGGQFEASTALPWKAVLHLVDDGGDYDADPTQYTNDGEAWTAVWNLDTSQLQKIAEATDILL